jgi:hypothetical protein
VKNIFSDKLVLTHKSGVKLYPAMMKNRNTGKLAFRLSKSGNTKLDSIDIFDEDEMIKKVTKQGYMVRARSLQPLSRSGRCGLYRLEGQSITSYSLI